LVASLCKRTRDFHVARFFYNDDISIYCSINIYCSKFVVPCIKFTGSRYG
jgi:hypothetical protein